MSPRDVAAERLGDAYASLARLVREHGIDDALQRGHLNRIIDTYGAENVRWLLGVIRNDIEAGRISS